jgi:pimeloyl-ACP methyl ester carboxylesterase
VRPETNYAETDGLQIAYQVIGKGPFDLILTPAWTSNLEWYWQDPGVARFCERLSSFCRLILFDKRGTGLSDPVIHTATFEQRLDDIRAVMDAAGSDQAVIFGYSEGGPMSILFAAIYPERVSSLVLWGAVAKGAASKDYPWPPKFRYSISDKTKQLWEPKTAKNSLYMFAPSVAGDEHIRQWWATNIRLGVSPTAGIDILKMFRDADVRHVLPVIHVPTLVLQRAGDSVTVVEEGRYLSNHIPEAKYVELPGTDHLVWWEDPESVLEEIEEFLTGKRGVIQHDRMLATIMFTDIVGSTERAVKMGDRRWRDLLNTHNALIRQEIARFRGCEVQPTGDGFLATFDGPARAIHCACAIRDLVKRLGIEIRAGLHTGECEIKGEYVGGIAAHIAARVMGRAGDSEVWVSGTLKDLVVGSGFQFSDRGKYKLKGVPDEWRLFTVEQ